MRNTDIKASRALPKMILSMVIFGTIGIFRRSLPLPSEVLAFARGIMGGLFLLLVMKARRKTFAWDRIRKRDLLFLVITGGMIGFNWILLFEAYNYTTVAVATLCYYMQPVIVICLAPLVLHESANAKQVVCVLLSVIGMVLVSGVVGGTQQSAGSFKGIALGLGAAALYAGVVLTNKRIADIPAYEKTIIQLFSAAFVLIPYMLLRGTLRSYPLSAGGIILLLIVGIVHTGIAYLLYFGAIEGLAARSSALLSYIDPVTAVLLSALLLGESMTGLSILGAVLIIGSAIFSEL